MNEEEIRLDQTKKVFDTIATLIKKNETCSYRYLIYDLLGFKEKDYATLLSGMALTNKLVNCETNTEIINKAIEYNKKVLTWTTNEEITDEIANENLSILKGE